MLWISAKIALPVLSNVESRRRPCDCQIHNASFICGRLDGVRRSVFTESNSAAVGVARKLLWVEVKVLERIGGPEIGGLAVRVEDLGVELACSVYTANMRVSACFFAYRRSSAVLRDIAVYDLSHSNMPTICHQVESLCLDTRRSHCSPF